MLFFGDSKAWVVCLCLSLLSALQGRTLSASPLVLLSNQASRHKELLSSLPPEPLLDPSFTGIGRLPASGMEAGNVSGLTGGGRGDGRPQSQMMASRLQQPVGRHGGSSGVTLSARMQRLLEQQRVHQDKLAVMSAAGTLRQHLLGGAEAGDGGGRGRRCLPVGAEAGEGGEGERRQLGDQDGQGGVAMEEAATGPARGQQEGGRSTTMLRGAVDDGEEAICLLMRTCGPCSREGHLLKCPVSFCRLTRGATGGGAWGPAVALLQSKGLAQSLGPLGEMVCEFTVHRPWHELRVPGCSEPVVLVFCAMPGHISTDG